MNHLVKFEKFGLGNSIKNGIKKFFKNSDPKNLTKSEIEEGRQYVEDALMDADEFTIQTFLLDRGDDKNLVINIFKTDNIQFTLSKETDLTNGLGSIENYFTGCIFEYSLFTGKSQYVYSRLSDIVKYTSSQIVLRIRVCESDSI